MTVSNAAVPCLDKDARIAELEAALAARDTLIDTLRVQLAQLRRMTFGQSSEKLSLQIEQLELTLEELEGEVAVSDARTIEPTTKVERLSPVRSLPDHLPRAERRIEPDAGTCNCPQCGGDLRPLGEDSDEMLDVLPVQWRVIRTAKIPWPSKIQLPVLRDDCAGTCAGQSDCARQGNLRNACPYCRQQVRSSFAALPAGRDDGCSRHRH